DRDLALFTHEGDPNASGLLLVGASNGVATFKPGCDVEVLPLQFSAPVRLDGLGREWLAAHVPSRVGPLDLFVQSFFFLPPSKLPAATKPVPLHVECRPRRSPRPPRRPPAPRGATRTNHGWPLSSCGPAARATPARSGRRDGAAPQRGVERPAR